MQQTIQQITQKLIDRLPDNDQYYRLDELRSWDFPPYIVQRIRIELERNLAESMIIPKTDWANTQSDAVLDAWQQFVDAIRAEARLPASYGKTVIETAVADVVEMLVQPCKTIPDVVFGSDESLSAEKISKRLQAVVVYRHFARLILRYMQKKELDSLDKSRCKDIIRKADQKLTQRYSPLNWAQMLDTLFKLLGGNIDSELLRLFFEDKNRPRAARHFDLLNKELSRADLIEELSSPDLLNFEGYEDEQSTLFEDQPAESTVEKDEAEKEIVKEDSKKKKQDQDTSDKVRVGKKETQNELESSAEDETEVVDIASEFAKQSKEQKKEGSDSTKDFEEEKTPDIKTSQSDSKDNKEQKLKALNDAFAGQLNKDTDEDPHESKVSEIEETDAEHDESGEELDTRGSADSESAEADDASENEAQQPEAETEEIEDKEEQETDLQEENGASSQTNGEHGDENPMWMRFMSDEEIEEYSEEQEAEDEGFVEDPIIDLTNEDALDDEVEELADLLEGDRELFVEEIFGGSERAFDSAIEDIVDYSSWSDASKYIEKDIFKRNLVDVYSEAAVDFTDQLQSYFLEKENRN